MVLDINLKYLTLIITFFLFTGCVAEKKDIPPKHFKHNIQPKQIPQLVKEKVSVPKSKEFDFNGTWLAQATSSFVQRKLSLNRVNNSLQGKLDLIHITTRGVVYDKASLDVIIYLKGESIDGFISSGDSSENISIFRDSHDAFTVKVNKQRSKYFDSNEVRFIKYKTKQTKKRKVEFIPEDGSMLDKTHKVIWQDFIGNKILKSDYYAALDYCKKLDYLSFNDWFLPTRKQLITTINNNNFKNKTNSDYWSQTASLDQYGKAWYVDYDKAQMGIDVKTDKKYIRCIRKKEENEKDINNNASSNSASDRKSSRR